jgi:hypothetical protein
MRQLEKTESVTQKRREVFHFLGRYQDLLRRQGSVQAAWRLYRRRRLGPFYRLHFRENGRLKTLYLRGDVTLAAEVRQALADLQAPGRVRREIERQRGQVLAIFRATKRACGRELQARGLWLHGNEIRGWRGLPCGPHPAARERG